MQHSQHPGHEETMGQPQIKDAADAEEPGEARALLFVQPKWHFERQLSGTPG
jgi:hypothetical protein